MCPLVFRAPAGSRVGGHSSVQPVPRHSSLLPDGLVFAAEWVQDACPSAGRNEMRTRIDLVQLLPFGACCEPRVGIAYNSQIDPRVAVVCAIAMNSVRALTVCLLHMLQYAANKVRNRSLTFEQTIARRLDSTKFLRFRWGLLDALTHHDLTPACTLEIYTA